MATCHYKYYFAFIYYLLSIIYIYYVVVEAMARMIQAFYEDKNGGSGFISPRLPDTEIRRIAANVTY